VKELIEKLKIECSDLVEKFNKLDSFMDTKEYDVLDEYIRDRMIEQHACMLTYKWALRDRIEYMEEDLVN
jgi:hypothetical protein